MVDLQPQPKPLQSNPKCMNWISKSRTSWVVSYFKMISGFCITWDWTHFLPPKLMCTQFCLWKIWRFVYIITCPASLGPAPMATEKIHCLKMQMLFVRRLIFAIISLFRRMFTLSFIFSPNSQFSDRFSETMDETERSRPRYQFLTSWDQFFADSGGESW